jgi:hemerythrin-like domain-containing protein
MDLIEHLTQEHREAEALMGKLSESDPGPERDALIDELDDALTVHMLVEERFLYPIVSSTLGSETEEEAETEHSLARDGLAILRDLASAPGFGAAVEMLRAGVSHHVGEEESEVFPRLREKAADELASFDPEVLETQVEANEASRDELYERARRANIAGRSHMTKDELAEAVSHARR